MPITTSKDMMAAVQAMRQKAQAAGNLQSEPQETVTTQDPNISIEPVDPDEVYVPAYDPWVVYGDPIAACWVGIRIPESGSAARLFIGEESVSVSVSGAGTDGVGATGASAGAVAA